MISTATTTSSSTGSGAGSMHRTTFEIRMLIVIAVVWICPVDWRRPERIELIVGDPLNFDLPEGCPVKMPTTLHKLSETEQTLRELQENSIQFEARGHFLGELSILVMKIKKF